MIERQEIWCHNCNNHVQFDIDLSLNGNHVLECPNCGHEHCRVVRKGIITGDRWASRNGQTYTVASTSATFSYQSIYAQASGGTGAQYYLQSAWANTTVTTA
jgi:hypothetical protein